MTFTTPPTVRIGFADYSVIHMHSDEIAKADHYGITDNNGLTIRLDLDGAEARQVNTTIHEVLHGCWDAGDLGDAEPEEKVVAVLANQLCQVFRDNPALIVRMVAALAPEGK